MNYFKNKENNLMKVLHVCIDYTKLYKNLMEKEIDQGVEVKVFHYTTRRQKNKEISDKYVYFYNCSIRLLRTPLFFKTRINFVANKFIELYKDSHDFNLIHAHMCFLDGHIAYKAYKKWGIPYIIAVRNTDMNSWHYWNIPWNTRQGYEILKGAKKVVFLSKAYKTELIERIPVDMREELNRKSLIIPNGIDEFWHTHSKSTFKKAPEDTINILTVGTINSNKNHIAVIEAIELLIEKGYKVEYTIVGNIQNENIAEKLREKKYVKLSEFCSQDKLINIYEESDIFVLASIHETFGLVYPEAMTQGLPVIYSRGQGFDQQFQEGEVGRSVDSHKPEEIYEAIIKVLNDYEGISKRCIEASKIFDWKIISKKYYDIYKEIIKK